MAPATDDAPDPRGGLTLGQRLNRIEDAVHDVNDELQRFKDRIMWYLIAIGGASAGGATVLAHIIPH